MKLRNDQVAASLLDKALRQPRLGLAPQRTRCLGGISQDHYRSRLRRIVCWFDDVWVMRGGASQDVESRDFDDHGAASDVSVTSSAWPVLLNLETPHPFFVFTDGCV
jgi:hypothetical protein